MTTVPDLREIEVEPYVPREFPPEGLIPARVAYLKKLSVWAAVRAGWKVELPV